jgi:hypothetical protein
LYSASNFLITPYREEMEHALTFGCRPHNTQYIVEDMKDINEGRNLSDICS